MGCQLHDHPRRSTAKNMSRRHTPTLASKYILAISTRRFKNRNARQSRSSASWTNCAPHFIPVSKKVLSGNIWTTRPVYAAERD